MKDSDIESDCSQSVLVSKTILARGTAITVLARIFLAKNHSICDNRRYFHPNFNLYDLLA